MIKHIKAAIRKSSFKSAAMVCALTACVPGLNKKQAPFDTASIKRIEFKIGKMNPSLLSSTMSQHEIVTRVSENLADWGYSIGSKDNEAFSHTLIAEVGPVEISETPPGFSFSVGNSDPRAIDFQKADVLPISCELSSIAHPEQTTYLHMDFAIGNLFDNLAVHSISADKLADHISTVCFNLLNELDWPAKSQNQLASSLKPSWIPEVRIETVTSPHEAGKAAVPGKTVTGNNEGRKQIVIQNQGSPVIFSFGHER
ncbi:MAG: hypothetical protein PHG00_10515 [Methylococcales bacterium]|nr:hypothetical protein [Methylococcales bacterium]